MVYKGSDDDLCVGGGGVRMIERTTGGWMDGGCKSVSVDHGWGE